MADNRVMKLLFILPVILLILSATATSQTYIGCGGGLRQQGWHDHDWLKQTGDQFSFIECQLQANPPANQGWLWAFPELRWQQGLPTGVSRSRGYLQSQQIQTYWPLLRQQELVMGVLAGWQHARQQHTLTESMNSGDAATLLNPGQSILLNQQEYYAGISLDTRFSATPITRTSLIYRYRLQPMQIQGDAAVPWLSRTATGIGELRIEREALRFGWQWHGSLALFQGDVDTLNGQRPDDLSSNSYVGFKAHIGLLWRYRLHPQMYPYLNLSTSTEYWYAGNGPDVRLNSFSVADRLISTGITLRF